jgi:hypothetical protein
VEFNLISIFQNFFQIKIFVSTLDLVDNCEASYVKETSLIMYKLLSMLHIVNAIASGERCSPLDSWL